MRNRFFELRSTIISNVFLVFIIKGSNWRLSCFYRCTRSLVSETSTRDRRLSVLDRRYVCRTLIIEMILAHWREDHDHYIHG